MTKRKEDDDVCYVRLPKDIKERCQKKAKQKRMSLNQWIILVMEEAEAKP